MTRRFFSAMLAGAAFDPDKLLWVPGAKHISIPKPKPQWHVAASLSTNDVFIWQVDLMKEGPRGRWVPLAVAERID